MHGTSDLILRGLIVVLSLVGLWDALYFTFAYFGRVKKAGWVPEILCAREGSNCVTVVQTPYARVFGVPNSLLGTIYYVTLIAWSISNWSPALGIRFRDTAYVLNPVNLLIVVSAATVVLGFYLIYSLIHKLHTHCPLCYTAHAINLALLILLVLASS